MSSLYLLQKNKTSLSVPVRALEKLVSRDEFGGLVSRRTRSFFTPRLNMLMVLTGRFLPLVPHSAITVSIYAPSNARGPIPRLIRSHAITCTDGVHRRESRREKVCGSQGSSSNGCSAFSDIVAPWTNQRAPLFSPAPTFGLFSPSPTVDWSSGDVVFFRRIAPVQLTMT